MSEKFDEKIVGHKTFYSKERGYWHEPLTEAEGRAMIEASDAHLKKRAALMPDQQSAINMLFDAYDRLRELGWKDAIYCPKDGTHFQVIEAGSTGIFDANYIGKWPDGYWMHYYDDDAGPSHPLLWRPYPGNSPKKAASE